MSKTLRGCYCGETEQTGRARQLYQYAHRQRNYLFETVAFGSLRRHGQAREQGSCREGARRIRTEQWRIRGVGEEKVRSKKRGNGGTEE